MSLGRTQREIGLLSSKFDSPLIKLDLWIDGLDADCCRYTTLF